VSAGGRLAGAASAGAPIPPVAVAGVVTPTLVDAAPSGAGSQNLAAGVATPAAVPDPAKLPGAPLTGGHAPATVAMGRPGPIDAKPVPANSTGPGKGAGLAEGTVPAKGTGLAEGTGLGHGTGPGETVAKTGANQAQSPAAPPAGTDQHGAGQHSGGQHGAAEPAQPASSMDASQVQPSQSQPPQPAQAQQGHPQPVQPAAPDAPGAPVSQPAQPSPHPAVYQQLADPLLKLRASGDGSHSLTVALHPAELGPVNLHVRLVGDTMTIQLASSSESAHAALHAALGELRQELRGAGLGGVEVSLDLHGQSAGGFGQSGQRSSGDQPVTVPSGGAPAPSTTPVRPRSTTAGLDRWL